MLKGRFERQHRTPYERVVESRSSLATILSLFLNATINSNIGTINDIIGANTIKTIAQIKNKEIIIIIANIVSKIILT